VRNETRSAATRRNDVIIAVELLYDVNVKSPGITFGTMDERELA
jgi:hypothetical protein